MKDWEIIELLIPCGLYKSKLNKFQLSSHIVDAITNRADLELKNWMSNHQDCAKVNKGAIGNIFTTFNKANPVSRGTVTMDST